MSNKDEKPPTGIGADLHGEDEGARRDAARLMGSARSEKKTLAAQQNAKLPRQRPVKPLEDITCTCGRAGILDDTGKPLHPTTCPRGRVIRYRLSKGLPLT